MRPSPLARSLHLALLFWGLTAALLGSILLLQFAVPGDGGAMQAYAIVFCVYVAAGITAWWRRPGNRFGALIIGGGFAVFCAALGNASDPTLIAIGALTATVILAVVVHLLLAFPSGRVHGAASVIIVITAYATSTVLQVPQFLFTADAGSPLFLADLPGLVRVTAVIQSVAGVVIAVGTAAVLIHRLRNADPAHRRVLVPLFTYGLLAVLFIPFSGSILEPAFGVSAWTRGMLQLAVLGGVPIAFTFGVLRGGFARSAGLSVIGSWIDSGGVERSTLDRALAQSVGDPELVVAYWVHDRGIHVDADGATVVLPAPGERRASVDVEIDGRRIAAVVYDTALIADAAPVRDAARLAAVALDRQRLTAELHASERALAQSRARLERGEATESLPASSIAHLTARQREVLGLISQGLSNAAIARTLMLTEKSVVNHISRIFDALDLPVDADDHRRVRATLRFLSR